MSALRLFKRFTAVIGFLCLLANPGWSQTYPDRVVRYIVTDGPGSGADVLGRIVAAGLTKQFGQQVIVLNRPGVSGNIGMEIGVRSAPDGYTLIQMSSSHTSNVSLFRDLKFDLVRDLEPVTQISWFPEIVVVNPSLPVKSISELVALAKAKPGTLNYSSLGIGSTPFLATELFKSMTGTNIVHIPYHGGGEALLAVISDEVSIYFPPIALASPNIRAGRLRALAVTSATRSPQLPDLPTVAESGVPGYESIIWHGLVVPAKTPKAIVEKIHEAVVTALHQPEIADRLRQLGYTVVASSPEEFGAYIKKDIALQARVLKEAGVDKPF